MELGEVQAAGSMKHTYMLNRLGEVRAERWICEDHILACALSQPIAEKRAALDMQLDPSMSCAPGMHRCAQECRCTDTPGTPGQEESVE